MREQNPDLYRAYRALNELDLAVDIPALRKAHPGLMAFDDWLSERF